jgi:hypothetical protein
MKKYLAGLLTGIIIALSISAFAANEYIIKSNPYPVKINGVVQNIEALNIDDFTWIKAKDVGKFFNGLITLKFNEIDEAIEINTVTGNVYGTTVSAKTPIPLSTPPALQTPAPVQQLRPSPTQGNGIEYLQLPDYPKGDPYNAIKYEGELFVLTRPFCEKYKIPFFDFKDNTFTFKKGTLQKTLILDNNNSKIINERAFINISYLNDFIITKPEYIDYKGIKAIKFNNTTYLQLASVGKKLDLKSEILSFSGNLKVVFSSQNQRFESSIDNPDRDIIWDGQVYDVNTTYVNLEILSSIIGV